MKKILLVVALSFLGLGTPAAQANWLTDWLSTLSFLEFSAEKTRLMPLDDSAVIQGPMVSTKKSSNTADFVPHFPSKKPLRKLEFDTSASATEEPFPRMEPGPVGPPASFFDSIKVLPRKENAEETATTSLKFKAPPSQKADFPPYKDFPQPKSMPSESSAAVEEWLTEIESLREEISSFSVAEIFSAENSDNSFGSAASPEVSITTDDQWRYIQSNGWPNHQTGTFPNINNPNAIRTQKNNFRVTLFPRKNETSTPVKVSGVALNGISFEPGTAEYWQRDRRSGWRYEAFQSVLNLGLDSSNAHVQPTGKYHYHGVPVGLLETLDSASPVLVGYAADGFPIYFSAENASSYQLKSGARPEGAPEGDYDGTFTADYTYVAGSGNLDQCHGRDWDTTAEYPAGTYAYAVTTDFPYLPRCLWGTVDPSFAHRGNRF